MMRKNFVKLIFLLLIFSSCEKTEIKQIELKGTIEGQMYVYNEFGENNDDFENINVVLDDGNTKFSTTVNSNNEFLIDNIPTGTYDLIFSKEGYYVYQIQGLQIVGGDEPLHTSGYLIEETSTTIENISIELDAVNNLYLKSTVNHNGDYALIRYFLHNQENVSDSNYIEAGTLIFDGESGSQIACNMYSNTSSYSSGSEVYIIAYGCPIVSIGYYDILSNRNIWPVGEPSNVTRITIP
ncbi:carboxypeptidase-like regulatory domain-containing protein [Geofilum sp. OHC36d9]|uniref:carboxypeptidase-like regulatory domain-containing protein n=1 Tax=Geofilum sp. OHC36d9 TaxID=3458413 RepID=UPI004033387B